MVRLAGISSVHEKRNSKTQGKRARQKRESSLKGFYAVSRLYFTQKAMDKYFEQYYAAFRTQTLEPD